MTQVHTTVQSAGSPLESPSWQLSGILQGPAVKKSDYFEIYLLLQRLIHINNCALKIDKDLHNLSIQVMYGYCLGTLQALVEIAYDKCSRYLW